MGRRIAIERIRYISAPSDYLILLLLLVIGVSGVVMTFTSNHTDVIMESFAMLFVLTYCLV
jgi:nitrate reductase gamma subunit